MEKVDLSNSLDSDINGSGAGGGHNSVIKQVFMACKGMLNIRGGLNSTDTDK